MVALQSRTARVGDFTPFCVCEVFTFSPGIFESEYAGESLQEFV